MDETNETPAESTIENTATSNEGGNQPETLDKVERAEQAVKRMEDAEKRLDEKIAKLTELQADKILGSSAGGHIHTMTPEQSKEAKAKSMADDIVKAFK